MIHPRFARMISDRMAPLFPSLCAVEAKTVTADEFGQEVETWEVVAGMTLIPCAIAPLSAIERQAAGYTITDQVWHVLMTGDYPEITTRHRLLIDGVEYDIDGAEVALQGALTRLTVQRTGI